MIHLSKFLIGIRHSRCFRMRSLSGQLIDDILKIYPDKFTKVLEAQTNEEFILSNVNDTLFARINRDDIILEERKIFDWDNRSYVEINKRDLIDITEKIVPTISQTLSLKDDFMRIGMIVEFRIPKWDSLKDDNFGNFIFNNFILFETEGEKDNSSVKLTYKLKAPGGGAIPKLKDYRNVIIRIEESSGINEKGKEEKCLFLSADLQHIFNPLQKAISIKDHYDFAYQHVTSVIIPKFKEKGVEIIYE